MHSHGQAAQAKGLAISHQESDNLPDVLVGDTELLRKIFVHLVGNAIKFTEHGSVDIRIELAASTATTVNLRFSVSDTGPGIAPEILPQLTGLFVQGDGSSIRKHDGVGIGLPIARKLIELLGGQLEIESEPGKGSTFSFTLPFAIGSAN